MYSANIRTKSITPLRFMKPSGELYMAIYSRCEGENSQDEIKKRVYLEFYKKSCLLYGPILAEDFLWEVITLDSGIQGHLFKRFWDSTRQSPSSFLEMVRFFAGWCIMI